MSSKHKVFCACYRLSMLQNVHATDICACYSRICACYAALNSDLCMLRLIYLKLTMLQIFYSLWPMPWSQSPHLWSKTPQEWYLPCHWPKVWAKGPSLGPIILLNLLVVDLGSYPRPKALVLGQRPNDPRAPQNLLVKSKGPRAQPIWK